MYNLGLQLMRDNHGITAASAVEAAAAKNKKASKKRKAAVAALPAEVEYEDVEDDYSTHTDSEEPEAPGDETNEE